MFGQQQNGGFPQGQSQFPFGSQNTNGFNQQPVYLQPSSMGNSGFNTDNYFNSVPNNAFQQPQQTQQSQFQQAQGPQNLQGMGNQYQSGGSGQIPQATQSTTIPVPITTVQPRYRAANLQMQPTSQSSALSIVSREHGNASNALLSIPKIRMDMISQSYGSAFTNMTPDELKIYVRWMNKIEISDPVTYKTSKDEKIKAVQTRLYNKGVPANTSREYRTLVRELNILEESLIKRLWGSNFGPEHSKWSAIMLTSEIQSCVVGTLMHNCNFKPKAKMAYYGRKGAWHGLSFDQMLVHVMTRLRLDTMIILELIRRGLVYNHETATMSFPDPTQESEWNTLVYDPTASNIGAQLAKFGQDFAQNIQKVPAGDLVLGLCVVNPLIMFGSKELAGQRGQPLGQRGVNIQQAMSYYYRIVSIFKIDIKEPETMSFRRDSPYMKLFYSCYEVAQKLIAMVENVCLVKTRTPRIPKSIMRSVTTKTQKAFSDSFTDFTSSAPVSNIESLVQQQRQSNVVTSIQKVFTNTSNVQQNVQVVLPVLNPLGVTPIKQAQMKQVQPQAPQPQNLSNNNSGSFVNFNAATRPAPVPTAVSSQFMKATQPQPQAVNQVQKPQPQQQQPPSQNSTPLFGFQETKPAQEPTQQKVSWFSDSNPASNSNGNANIAQQIQQNAIDLANINPLKKPEATNALLNEVDSDFDFEEITETAFAEQDPGLGKEPKATIVSILNEFSKPEDQRAQGPNVFVSTQDQELMIKLLVEFGDKAFADKESNTIIVTGVIKDLVELVPREHRKFFGTVLGNRITWDWFDPKIRFLTPKVKPQQETLD